MRGELGDLTFEAWVRREWESADAEAKAQLKRMKKLNLLDDLGRKEYKDIKKKRCGHCDCEETPVMKFSVCSSCRNVAYCNEICPEFFSPAFGASRSTGFFSLCFSKINFDVFCSLRLSD